MSNAVSSASNLSSRTSYLSFKTSTYSLPSSFTSWISLSLSYSIVLPSVAGVKLPRGTLLDRVNKHRQFNSPDFVRHFPSSHAHLPPIFALFGGVRIGFIGMIVELRERV